jgi:hypothetical protein
MKTFGRVCALIRRSFVRSIFGCLWVGVMFASPVIAAGVSDQDATDYFVGRNGTAVKVTSGASPVDHTCNAGAFFQIPGQSDLFLGRARDYGEPGSGNKCDRRPSGVAVQWLALYKMNWQAHSLNYVQDVLKPPMRIAAADDRPVLLKNAYDPSVISYNGELWVAFECGGAGFRGASVCIGPLDRNTYTINDPRRVNMVIEGGPAENGFMYSASSPILIVFRGRVYVYWAALQGDTASGKWFADAVRGMEVVQERSGLRRMWGLGSVGRPAPSYAPHLNVEVAGVDASDPMSDQSVDLKGAYVSGNDIYMTAGLGGRGPGGKLNCYSGGGASYGCFRLQIFRSSSPLGPEIFNRHPLTGPKLPFNPTGYSRFFTDNHGQLSIMGYFFPPHPNYNTPYLVPSGGMWSFPVNLAELRFE